MTFEQFELDNNIVKTINKLGIKSPTEIQKKSIPYILQGKDVIGESATGSGKTLAFGLGILKQVKPGQGLQALVLTPTRELTEQVTNSLKKLSSNLKIIQVYGGVSIDRQIQELRYAEVAVVTPGRLLDHLKRSTINISKIKILVLDEADRMLDMGFIDDVERIIQHCPKQRQTLFFSATISSEIKALANRYMIEPVIISATKYVDPAKLKQRYYSIQKDMKLSLLVHLLNKEKSGLVMVFCNTRRTVDFVTRNLKSNRVNAIPIHGGLSQNKRTSTMDTFNNGKVSVLVCTDVAARGLHIENVSHVYNYEIPKDPKDYVHRIGRTARAGEEGKAISLLSENDHSNFSRILRDYSELNIERTENPVIERVSVSQPTRTFDNKGRESGRRPFNRGSRFSNSRPRRPFNRSEREETRFNSRPRKSFGYRKDESPRRSFGSRREEAPRRFSNNKRPQSRRPGSRFSHD